MLGCHHNQKEPYVPFDIPIVAWKSITTDLFTFQDKTFMVIFMIFSCQTTAWGDYEIGYKCLEGCIQ